MKYKTIGAFKSVQNIPYCKAAEDMKVGMGVILDRVAKTASLPTSEAECQGINYIVTNINDKPEIRNSQDAFVVLKDEYVRADDLRTVNALEIEFAAFEIENGTTDLAVGDELVFGVGGMLVKAADASAYATSFKILEKTAYMDDGVLAEIVAQ